jgi:hypothetical protein
MGRFHFWAHPVLGFGQGIAIVGRLPSRPSKSIMDISTARGTCMGQELVLGMRRSVVLMLGQSVSGRDHSFHVGIMQPSSGQGIPRKAVQTTLNILTIRAGTFFARWLGNSAGIATGYAYAGGSFAGLPARAIPSLKL